MPEKRRFFPPLIRIRIDPDDYAEGRERLARHLRALERKLADSEDPQVAQLMSDLKNSVDWLLKVTSP
jgi:CHASE3 domain sensor protein